MSYVRGSGSVIRHGRPQAVPQRITVAGRTLITRAELARLCGLTTSTLAVLYAKRAENGHPVAVHVEPECGALYFDEEKTLRWHRSRRRARPGRSSVIDYRGNPDDLVTTAEAARILGYHGPATIRAYLSRYPGYFPTPDRAQMLPNGREKKLWRRSSVWAFAIRRG